MVRRAAAGAGALALVAAFALTQSLRLDVGAVTRPGPGLFPLVLSAALLVTALGLLAGAWRGAPVVTADDAGPRVAWPLIATIAAFAIYVVAFEPIGFLLTTSVWLVFLFGVVARYRWPVAIVTGIVIALAARLVFDTWLSVRLPRGLLGP